MAKAPFPHDEHARLVNPDVSASCTRLHNPTPGIFPPAFDGLPLNRSIRFDPKFRFIFFFPLQLMQTHSSRLLVSVLLPMCCVIWPNEYTMAHSMSSSARSYNQCEGVRYAAACFINDSLLWYLDKVDIVTRPSKTCRPRYPAFPLGGV